MIQVSFAQRGKKNSQEAQWKIQIQLQEQEVKGRMEEIIGADSYCIITNCTAFCGVQRMVAFGSSKSVGVYTYKLSLQTHGYI